MATHSHSSPADRASEALTTLDYCLNAIWTAAGTALFLLAPSAAPIVLPLSLVLPLAWQLRMRGKLDVFALAPASIALAIAAGYAFLNARWSPARVEAHQFATMLLIVAACAPLTITALQRLDHHGVVLSMATGFYAGYAAVSAFWCFEILTQAAAHTRLMELMPALWPNSLRYVANGGELPDYFLNQKMTGLTGLFWPAVLTATYLTAHRRALLFCGLLPAVIAIGVSENQTSEVALLTSATVFAVFRMAPRGAYRISLAGWTIACLAVVPLCLAAYFAEIYKARWLQPSAQHRIVIWKATSDRVFDAPVLGHGIHASRIISKREPPQPVAPGTGIPLSVSWHSHNAFLQVWFETGAIGAIILLVFGLLVLRSVRYAPQPAQPALMATFSSCAMLCATGYSAFAPWVSSSLALAAIFAALATHLVPRRHPSP